MSDRAVFHNPLMRDGYVQAPNPIILCPEFSEQARLMYLIVFHFAWKDPENMPTQEELARHLYSGRVGEKRRTKAEKKGIVGRDRKSVQRYLDELQAEKLIQIVRRGQGRPNEYHILDFYKTRPELFVFADGTKLSHTPEATKKSHQGETNSSPPEATKKSQAIRKEEDGSNTVQQQWLQELKKIGMPEAQAITLLEEYGEAQVGIVLMALSRKKAKVEHPAGWVVSALKGKWDLRTAGERRKESEARKMQADKGRREEAEKEAEASEDERSQVDDWIVANGEEAMRMFDEEKAKLEKEGKFSHDRRVAALVKVRIAKEVLGLS